MAKTVLHTLVYDVNTDIEAFRKSLDEGQAGDQLGALLRGVKKDEIRRGMVLCKPGSLSSHNKIKAQVGERHGVLQEY